MPILERNISVNKQNFPDISVEASVLDWDEPLPTFTADFSEGFDAIVSVIFFLSR